MEQGGIDQYIKNPADFFNHLARSLKSDQVERVYVAPTEDQKNS